MELDAGDVVLVLGPGGSLDRGTWLAKVVEPGSYVEVETLEAVTPGVKRLRERVPEVEVQLVLRAAEVPAGWLPA